MPKSRRAVLYAMIAVAAAMFLFGSAATNFYIDLLWFRELGYDSVYWRIFVTRLLLFVLGGTVFTVILYANLKAAHFSVLQFPFGLIPHPYEKYFRPRFLRIASLILSAFFGLIAGVGLADQWQTVELFRNRVAWGAADPVFGQDLSFYMFSLPFYRLVLQMLNVSFVLALLIVGIVYVVTGAVRTGEGRIRVHPGARMHLGFLAAVLLLLKGIAYGLDAYDLLRSTRGIAFGANYTDLHAVLPSLRLLSLIAFAAAGAALYAAYRQIFRPLVIGILSLVVASVALGSALPALVQRFIVEPNELERERTYIEYNITATREAFGMGAMTVREFPSLPELTWQTIAENRPTIENVRLWDVRPLQSTYRQRQNIRQYYDFFDVDVDRYSLDGRYQQVMLAARELDHEQLESAAQTWVNRHLRFTHGYGAVMSPAASLGQDGQPLLYLRDIPPQSSVDLQITRPEIYFGELIEPYAIVLTNLPEFDYPVGDTIATSFYEGNAGIPVGSFLHRLAFSLYTGDYNILLSGAIQPESRILIHRRVLSRISRIAPFLRFDEDPYLVIREDGSLFWMVDAYTLARDYPYSEPYTGTYAPPVFRGANYIRNSVKVTVDAYHGDVRYYIFAEDDPLIRAYANIFPDLFQTAEEMPEDLRAHTRYPLDLFRVQAEMYTIYHMTDPDVFYNREDVWALPQELFDEAVVMEPYYLIMQLPGEPSEEFLLMLPFTPANRNNMIGWMAGRSDGDQLGELFVFSLPKDRQVFGPMQVENRINQHGDIARDLALWDQQGTRVIRGNLLVIPVGESLLYVEPLYLRSEDGGIPELRRVIVTFGDRQPVMEPTFESALARLLGPPQEHPEDFDLPGQESDTDGFSPPGVGDPVVEEWIRQALRLYREAEAALRRADLATYGEYVQELGNLLDRLEKRLSGGEDRDPANGDS